ncbi:hypothetical protein ACU61A_37180 [Pseudonocardia sichuanensis]|uniref:hypothetical protein n=1 Tax=Pseudonocardia kunmingensis TaxID=630975 RepID=UPI001B8619B5|nr:hypothetical protein [Pseudonocardia kunmingensis]
MAARVRHLGGDLVDLTARAVTVIGLDEQHRYLLQHTLGVQVHDRAKPHHHRRHGRADLGWPTSGPTAVTGPVARAAGPDVDREEVQTTCRSCPC